MWGGPSQLDTWDPKPDAPEDIRGPFRAISTTVPGHLDQRAFPVVSPASAPAVDRAVDEPRRCRAPVHGTSCPDRPPGSDAVFRRGRTFAARLAAPRGDRVEASPDLGCDAERGEHALDGHASGRTGRQGSGPGRRLAGQGVRPVPSSMATRMRHGLKSRGSDCPEGSRPAVWPIAARSWSDSATLPRTLRCHGHSWDRHQQKALDALGSAEARRAFQIDREDPRLRDRYGRHIHGQCLLLARRLIEAGVGLVTVNWHNDGKFFWDTHGDNFNQLKNRLMPPADQGFSALLEDLNARGLLDETLVVWVGEFGRTPRINRANSGREHWPHCYSAVLAGAGVRGGSVVWRLRPLGRLSGQRPCQPRRPRCDDPARPGHRPRNAGQRRRRPPPADQRGHAARAAVWLSRPFKERNALSTEQSRAGACRSVCLIAARSVWVERWAGPLVTLERPFLERMRRSRQAGRQPGY